MKFNFRLRGGNKFHKTGSSWWVKYTLVPSLRSLSALVFESERVVGEEERKTKREDEASEERTVIN